MIKPGEMCKVDAPKDKAGKIPFYECDHTILYKSKECIHDDGTIIEIEIRCRKCELIFFAYCDTPNGQLRYKLEIETNKEG